MKKKTKRYQTQIHIYIATDAAKYYNKRGTRLTYIHTYTYTDTKCNNKNNVYI